MNERVTAAPQAVAAARAYRRAGEPTAHSQPSPDIVPGHQRPVPHAVHRAIICVDVEGFGDRRRTHLHHLAVRDGLYRCLATAFARSQVRWEDCQHEDRGDGVLILVPPEIPKTLLATGVPGELAAALTAHNQTTNDHRARIRLRLAIHAGEVHLDEYGVTGTAINMAFRLLDADPTKRALDRSSGTLAVIASRWFFDEVIRHTPASGPASYRPVRISVKETTTKGWICLPDDPYPPDEKVLDNNELTIDVRTVLAGSYQRLKTGTARLFGRFPADVCGEEADLFEAHHR